MKSSKEKYLFERGHFEIDDPDRAIFYSDCKTSVEEVISHRKDGSVFLHQYTVQGRLHGPSRSYFAEGTLASERWFVDDVAHGRAVDFSPSQVMIFRSAYRHGKLHGKFEKWNDDGSILLSGAFIDGAPEGTFVVYAKDGLVLHSTSFVQGRRDGIEFAWTEDHYALFCERWALGERIGTIIPDPLLRRS